MGIKIASNFSPRFTKPLDDRQQFSTLSAMKNFSASSVSDGLITYCLETNKYYVYNSSNDVDAETGKWREFYLPIIIRPYEIDSSYEKGELCYFQNSIYRAYEDIEYAPSVFDSTQWELVVTNATVYVCDTEFVWDNTNHCQVSLSSIKPQNPQIQIGYSLFDSSLVRGRVSNIENGIVTVVKIDTLQEILNVMDYPSLDITSDTLSFINELRQLEIVPDKIMYGTVKFSDLPHSLTSATVQISILKPELGDYLIIDMVLFDKDRIYLWDNEDNQWSLIGTNISAGNDISLTVLDDGTTQIDCFVDEIDGGLIEQ